MTTDICSILTYQEIIDNGWLSEKRARVLALFTERWPLGMTATEVVIKLGRGFSEGTRNRITELEKMGYLKKLKKVCCKEAAKNGRKRLVNYYVYTGRKEPKEKKHVLQTCNKCFGTGRMITEIYVEPGE